MCGIVGIVKLEKINKKELLEARDILYTRGPDDAGFFIDCNIGLAHRRLSIIDLSSEGRQPMSDSNRNVVIVFNGEIYNYKEIRKELIRNGFTFNGNSDTEVLLTSYLAWGTECVNKFNGMFAFAIYDKIRNTLFLARDRAGQKPLYYIKGNGYFVFASQIKAFKAISGVSWDINFDGVNAYLAKGYFPGEMSPYTNIKKLLPAHSAIYDLENKKLKIWQYWQLPAFSEPEVIPFNEALYELEKKIEKSVAYRLISDVPVGILLSGGVDSSIVAALAQKNSSKQIKTFCIKMDDTKLDESDRARKIADFLGTEHFELKATYKVLEVFEKLHSFCDEPISDSSIIPTYVLSRLIKDHVTVGLGGDGGDELFGGYKHYLNSIELTRRLSFTPKYLLRKTGHFSGQYIPIGYKGRNFLQAIKDGPEYKNINGTSYFDFYSRKKMYNEDFVKKLNYGLNYPEERLMGYHKVHGSMLYKLQRTDFLNYLPEDVLAKVDRASMGNSLEVRAPWLDSSIIEFAFKKIPDVYKIYNGKSRIIQAELANKLLPGVIDVSRKQGFSIPLNKWLMNKKINEFLKLRILNSGIGEIFNFNFINKLFDNPKSCYFNSSRIFALYMLLSVDL